MTALTSAYFWFGVGLGVLTFYRYLTRKPKPDVLAQRVEAYRRQNRFMLDLMARPAVPLRVREIAMAPHGIIERGWRVRASCPQECVEVITQSKIFKVEAA